MRLFVALDIDAAIRTRLAQFVAEVRSLVPEARWVSPQSYHLTLKFIGERPPAAAQAITQALAGIQSAPTALAFRGAGFFPNARSARVFWAGIAADANLPALARQVDTALSKLQIPLEEHPFSPHLTLARGKDARHPGGGSGRPSFHPGDRRNSRFARLQEKLETLPPPEFGAMTATEFFLYESKLSPAGAQYTKLARFPLRAEE